VEPTETTPSQAAPPPPASHARRLWSIALGAAIVAALAAWGVEESSLHYYGPQMTAKTAPREYRADLRGKQPGEGSLGGAPSGGPGGGVGGAPRGGGPPGGGRGGSPYGASRATHAYHEEFTAKAVALSGGAVGAMFGLALGLALGFAGGRSARSWIVGVVASVIGVVVCGVAGWMATQALVPIFYQARADNPGSPLVIASLLLIRGVPRMIAGLAGGLALGVAAGGGSSRMIRGALGGMIGAALGVALMVIGDEAISLFTAQQEIATSPILRSPLHRMAAILAVTIPSAVCAASAILHAPKRQTA